MSTAIDGGASWEPLELKGIIALVVSPADQNQLYANTGVSPAGRHTMASQDGGSTWHTNEDPLGGPVASFYCPNSVLLAHGADPGRALRARGCVQTDIESIRFSETTDRGATWTDLRLPASGALRLALSPSGRYLHAAAPIGVFDRGFRRTTVVEPRD